MLDDALEALDRAEALGARDALFLNSRGNALGLLQLWPEALAAYEAASAVAAKDFLSIPRSNAALVQVELGQLDAAEALAQRLIREDPNFVDALALLAAIRSLRGDPGGAANAVARLCTNGALCERYASVDVVLGRWTP